MLQAIKNIMATFTVACNMLVSTPTTPQNIFDTICIEKQVNAQEKELWAFIIEKESGGQPHATNSSSGAYGLGQALPKEKMLPYGNIHSAETQLRWMYDYMIQRYGSITNAYNFWITHHWY